MESQQKFHFLSIKILCMCHVVLIAASNILVQYPFEFFGYHTTWGAFTYPAIFILTDLTIRLANVHIARKIIFCSMIPGLFVSYWIATYLEITQSSAKDSFFVLHTLPLRVALGCFIAYTVGQLLDITLFQRYRNSNSWWLAPTLSSCIGNITDTLIFFSIAFYQSNNPYLKQHWMEIAIVDSVFKLIISIVAFIPTYGLILGWVRKGAYKSLDLNQVK